jgi:hypothetical protein
MLLILFLIVHTFIRIYIFAKVFYLMCMTYYYPETYPISLLTWWIYFLIFDIWIDHLLNNKKIEKVIEKKDESID